MNGVILMLGHLRGRKGAGRAIEDQGGAENNPE
jgi:hypothetical protein